MWNWQKVCVYVPSTAQPQYFFIVTLHSPRLWRTLFFKLSFHSNFYLSLLLFSAAKKSDIFLLPLSPYLSVSDEGRDLWSCLTVSAGLRDCSPSPLPLPACLSACLAVPPCHTSAQTTKTPFAASDREPACPGIPTSGENSLPHCYALIACQVPFLFCSLVFLPLFFSYFLTLPLSWLFSLLATPSLCLHIALLSRFPQWPLSFLPLFYSG